MQPLHAFERVARSGGVGEPVFLQCLVTCPPERAEETLAATLAAVIPVLGDQPATLFARGDPPAGILHATLAFRSGACALVAVGPGEDTVDVTLLGNHGAAYLPKLAALAAPGARCPVPGGGERLPSSPQGTGHRAPGAAAAPLLEAIRRSLAEGRPVKLEAVDA